MQLTKSFLDNKLDVRLNVRDMIAKGQPLNYFQNFDNKPFNYKKGTYSDFWSSELGTTISLTVGYRF
jgi:hypothetical protein